MNKEDCGKLIDLTKERALRGVISDNKKKEGIIIDLAKEKTLRGITDDDQALFDRWEKRRIDLAILEGVVLPSYDYMVDSLEKGDQRFLFIERMKGELAKEPAWLRMASGDLIKLSFPYDKLEYTYLSIRDSEDDDDA